MVNGRVSAQQGKTPAQRRGTFKRWSLALAVSSVLGLAASSARADLFFDWLGEVQRPVPVAGSVLPAGSTYVTAPTLDDTTVTQVAAFLASQPAGQRAVKVRAGVTLSPTTIQAIYGTYDVKYTFADYEGPTAVTQTTTLVNQIKASTVTGPSVNNNASFVGNFQISPIPTDNTHPNSVTYTSGNSAAEPYFTATDFRNSGVNMSNESLYPGDASFRNPIFGTNTAGSGSNSPNIRSALFTLPITRLSLASQNIGVGQQHIPYVARFNNSDNAAIVGGQPTGFANAISNGQAAFDTNGSSIGGQAVAGQLLSRDDFQALILHYRMRGASSYQLLDTGVVGYTQAQEESDAAAGWSNSLVGGVLSGLNGRAAALGTTITVDGNLKTIENAGVVFSAVTNDDTTSGQPQLAVLVSNMDGASHVVSFNTRINGATLSGPTGVLGAGTHTILRFTKTGSIWTPSDSTTLFIGDSAALTSRDGVGIPEPTSLSLLGLAAFGVLGRRRRKA